MSRRRALVLAAAVALAITATACDERADRRPGPQDGAVLNFSPKATLVISDGTLSADTITVRLGDAITVENRGTSADGITSATIDTGNLKPGESTTVFLAEVGTIHFHLRTDPHREGTIVVSPES